jgi:hypothetical protein
MTNFNYTDKLEVSKFLETLESGKVYVVTFEFVYSFDLYDEDRPTINLTRPNLVTKNSNPELISKILQKLINITCETSHLNDLINEESNTLEKGGIIEKHTEINLFL